MAKPNKARGKPVSKARPPAKASAWRMSKAEARKMDKKADAALGEKD